ncbi:MAG TPA: cobalamin-independent methionine synthase II family protein [Ktedonobacteraceae bacterium]
MKHSTERILTTHAGSLPRSDKLMQVMFAREQGQPIDAREIAATVQDAVATAVKRQIALGLDIISDGEMSKIGFANYVKDRLAGFSGQSADLVVRDVLDHPDLHVHRRNDGGGRNFIPACTGPISLRNPEVVQRDLANLQAALEEVQPEGVFLPAASPGAIAQVVENHYYPDEESYLLALADAMRYEYQAIVAAGYSLQLDCPDLAMQRHVRFADAPLAEFRAYVQRNVEVLNYALKDIPSEQVRVHVCWGNYNGPHDRDVPLKDLIDLLLKIQCGALSLEAANPRHEHEWNVFEQVHLPTDKLLIPGMVDSCSNYVEHPEVIAQRIVRFARVVGRENIIAGTDCGFDTFAGSSAIAPSIAWAKLQALVEGARLASEELWK